MRVLFTCLPATGHFHSLLPLAEAAADAGHDVAFCCGSTVGTQAAKAGFEHLPGGADTFESLFANAPPRTDPDRWRWVQRIAFATRGVDAMLAALESQARRWLPDVIVRETAEFAGCLVAERLGIPHASVATGSWSARGEMRFVVAEVLDGWRGRLGLGPDPDAEMVRRYLTFALTPARWDGGEQAHAATTHFIRYVNPRTRSEPRPDWLDGMGSRPLVLASLGTVHHAEEGVFEAILEAVADEPIDVVAAVGRAQDPARFGRPPANVRIEQYVPQLTLLAKAAAFITHGGFNSAKEALSLGVPLLVTPIGGDQPYTAERVEALGLGRRISPDERTPGVIRTRLREILRGARYRSAAQRFAADMAALPSVDHAVGLLERLVVERRPVVRA